MRFSTLLFDLDGTIIDSAPGIFRSAHQTIAEMNLPAVTDEDLRRFIGPPLKISFMRVTGCDEITAEKAAARYRELYAGATCF
jgi:phosphoglycolate phosphatase